MHLESRPSYLALHDTHDGRGRRLTLLSAFEQTLTGWTVGSRISPIWRLSADGRTTGDPANLGNCKVTFIGPTQPARLYAEIKGLEDALSCWATLGCFNLIVHCDQNKAGEALARRLTQWADKCGIAFEQWTLTNGVVSKVSHQVLPPRKSAVLSQLSKFAENHKHPALRSTFQENLVATATSLARAAAVYPPIHADIERAAESIGAIMEQFAAGKFGLLEMQSRLLAMNAALSRFSSQAFSGIPPIQGTECHFWIHSLLGTGSANIALANIVSTVQLVLGEACIPERLQLLSKVVQGVPTPAELTSDISLLDRDLLMEVDVVPDTTATIVPLITYFSGRDGFSSNVQTLSAPLTTLAECNSLRSNLLTVTHEISHIFVQSALAEISPTPGQISDFQNSLTLLQPHYKAANMLEAAQQLFLEAVISMSIEERHANKPYSLQELEIELPKIVERTRSEAQEILVHTFDFLYFHAGEPEYYINNIWHSWCSIPGIADRVPEYLMRTLCAVSSVLLRDQPKTRFAAALQSTKQALQKIEPLIGLADNYVSLVLRYIKKVENDPAMLQRLERQYGVRMRLVRLVRIFLFSDKLAARLFHDPHIGGGDGYKLKKPLAYDTNPVGNALQFLRTHLKASPSEAESMWVLHALAFDTPPRNRGTI